MVCETSLPWPAVWSRQRPGVTGVLVTGFLGFLALGLAGVGVYHFPPGERAGLVLVLCVGAVSVGAITAMDLWMARGRRRQPPSAVSLEGRGSVDAGIAISYSSRFCHLLRPLLLVSTGIVVGFAAGGVMGRLAPFGTPAPDAASSVAGGAALCLLVVWAAWVVWVAAQIAGRRVARGRLVLRPDGIYHRTFTFEHFAPWPAVVDVHAGNHGFPVIVVRAFPTEHTRVRRTAWLGKQPEFSLLPFLVVRCRWLAIDPAIAYHALRYYHAHPEARGELRTAAGAQRIRSGDLLDRPRTRDLLRPPERES